ncbi:MAG: PAC2 family protein [Candidatus Nanohaloarchaea archaeon]|nr:PAC2 family protein [Candidatus Nanohaloarchaea archaeon]
MVLEGGALHIKLPRGQKKLKGELQEIGMARINVRNEVDIEDGFFIEGVPGAGLAGKIAADHLIENLDMELHATVEAEGLPEVLIFEEGDRHLRPPVRIFADEDTGIYALTSDVLISPVESGDFSGVLVDWIEENSITPLMLSGLPSKDEGDKKLYGVEVGEEEMLDEADIGVPDQTGLVGGPTGAMLHELEKRGMDGACLVVQTHPQFPDPIAAKRLVDGGVEKLVDFDVDTEVLEERAEKIKEQKEKLAQMLQNAESHEKGQAFPEGMYE